MNIPPRSLGWYEDNAPALAAAYEALDPAVVHAWLVGMLPRPPALVLDVGAGTGRDAVWLARLGHDVVAVEPLAAIRAEAQRRHPNAGVRWVVDQLPSLPAIYRLGLTFDLILLSGVWQHVAPGERQRALRKVLGLLGPGGVLALTLRVGPAEVERAMYPVSLPEVERLARDQGAMVAHVDEMPDQMARPHVSWTRVALCLPDDGTGALPLLHYVILNDAKSATYKLGLLRALCRAADGQAGLAEAQGQETVVLPLGLVALNWLRLYLPLVEAKLPQTPGNGGPDGLGFARDGFALSWRGSCRISGRRFAGPAARAVQAALQEAADLIARMPATYMTYPNGGPILPTVRRRASQPVDEIVLDGAFPKGFGTLAVPRELWRALGRFSVWAEPPLIAEWLRLMRGYGRDAPWMKAGSARQ
jgi:SAM-dependent methyltransferase